ncbi:MAG: hypothetical protein A2Z03_02890 [Chloroflexi bacterium RBG_16_56_8]|nr:MAG: hypothetical protein A2Z03_02890 [Chloroflexi bacterium RBG_16_56_8]
MLESSNAAEIRRLEQRLGELQALVQVIGRINRSLPIDEILHTSQEGIQRVLEGKFGCFVLVDPDARKLELAHAHSLPSSLHEQLQLFVTRFQFPPTDPTSQDYVDLIALLGDQVREILRTYSAESSALIPLTARSRPVGILIVGIGTPRVLMPISVDLLMSIGEQVGMAIEQARLNASLSESEQFHRAFIENSPDGIWEGDFKDHILYVNEAACRIMGYTREELLQMQPSDLIVDKDTASSQREKLFQQGFLTNYNSEARTKSGEIKTVSISTRLVRDAQGNMVRYQSIFRDVTEQQHSIATLDRRNHELSALNAIGNILSHPLEISRALDEVCQQITSITSMETAAVYLVDERQQKLNLVAHRGIEPELIPEVRQVGLDDDMARSIAADGQPFAADDVMIDQAPGFAGPRRAGYHAGIGVPIKLRGKPVGAIFVGSKQRCAYEKADVALLTNIGERIGMAMENHDLYDEMRRRADELDGLARLSAACTSSLDPTAISQIAVEWTKKLLDGDLCSIRLLENDDLRLGAVLGQREGLPAAERFSQDELSQTILNTRTPFVVADVAQDPNFSQNLRDYMAANHVYTFLAAPLPTTAGVIGFITVSHSHPYPWQQREIDLMQTIANQTASAIHNAQLSQNVLRAQQKVQAVFDSGISGLFATDPAGRIVMFNHAAERITGWTLREIQGQLWADVFANTAAPNHPEPLINEALVRKKTIYVPDGRYLQTRDGRMLPVAKAVAPLMDDNGTVTGAVGAFWDLTREKAAEQTRENFLKMVAHQMRNPLTVLGSALELLDKTKLPKQLRKDMYNLVKSQAERLNKFSQQFLDLEKAINSGRPVDCQPLPVADLVNKLVGEFDAIHTNYHFAIEPCEQEPIAHADADRVDNILRNLLDNAVAYSDPGSHVTVSINLPGSCDQVIIAVRDQGIGIPILEQDRIFNAFFRASQPEGRSTYGHGFGLYVAHQMARQMNGDIQFTSREGEGSTFHLILRRSQ